MTHTLAGAALAQTRFGRVPLGTATLIVGANLPDIDAATYLIDGDLALTVRRGWTHGVLAMVVLPALLGWVMHQVDLVRCRRNQSATPVPVGRLVALSYLSVLSHPAMDWLNTYGVRLLMPFSGRWFYGDSLFIIDPWVWLLLGLVAVLGYSHTRLGATRAVVIGGIATLLVTGFPGLPAGVRLLWLAGVGAIAVVRFRGRFQQALPRVATACLVVTGLYVSAMVVSSQLARGQVVEWARDRQLEPRRIMMGPAPGSPFLKNVVLADDRHYHRLAFDWLGRERITPLGPETAIGDDHPAATAALAAPAVRGLATWTRLPVFEVEPTADGYRVRVGDLRFGNVTVDLDRDLRPR